MSPSSTAFNKAFGQFFARLAQDGITTSNTLFIITADENDHFVGGPPSPANCDGVNIPCTYAKKGEIDADLSPIFQHRVRRHDAVPRAQRRRADLLHQRQPQPEQRDHAQART